MQAWNANNNAIILGTQEEADEYKALYPYVQVVPLPVPVIHLKGYLREHGLKAQIDELADTLQDLKCREKNLTEDLVETRTEMRPISAKLAELQLRYNAI